MWCEAVVIADPHPWLGYGDLTCMVNSMARRYLTVSEVALGLQVRGKIQKPVKLHHMYFSLFPSMRVGKMNNTSEFSARKPGRAAHVNQTMTQLM